MEFKFKLGDLVRIKRGLIADSYYKTEDGSTLYCATEMVGYGGLCAKITKLEERCGHRTYKLSLDSSYHWSDSMLEYIGQNKYRIGGKNG